MDLPVWHPHFCPTRISALFRLRLSVLAYFRGRLLSATVGRNSSIPFMVRRSPNGLAQPLPRIDLVSGHPNDNCIDLVSGHPNDNCHMPSYYPQDGLLVTGVATSLILIVMGSFKKKL
jgi:hypothetical protein